MSTQSIIDLNSLQLDGTFRQHLALGLRAIVDESFTAAHAEPVESRSWDAVTVGGLRTGRFVHVECLTRDTGIMCGADEIRQLLDATGRHAWADYDGRDSAVLFVDLLPSANWAHPGLAVLYDPWSSEFHERRKMWFPLEPGSLSIRHARLATVFDLPNTDLRQC